MKVRYYLITGALAYLLFLIISIPATAIYLFEDTTGTAKLQGLGGSLWNGHAQRISISSQYVIDDVSWSFCAWRLFTGEACFELEAKYLGNRFSGQLGATLAQSFKIRELSTEIDARILGELLRLPIGKLSGLLSIDIEAASWARGSAPGGKGIITWSNAAITVAETVNLGTVNIALTESGEYPLNAVLSNKGGHIKLNGTASISDNGDYTLVLNMDPTSQASKNVHNSLAMIAKKQTNGSFILKNSGNLEQFGLM